MKKIVPVVVLSALASHMAHAHIDVIYGEDNRLEVYEAPALLQKLAKSTAAMIPVTNISRDSKRPGLVQLDQKTLKDWLEAAMSENAPSKELFSSEALSQARQGISFCEGVKFIGQPNPAICSGYLIAPDLVVTAGHCVEIEKACENYQWVFDFKLDKDTQTAGVDVKEEDVYKCKRVVTNALSTLLDLDYGIMQLDRPVKGREPLEIRNDTKIEDNADLVVIGHPSGLPLKVAGGAKVRSNKHPFFFSANLDTFQGNSGSAVFNAKTGVVEGILVRGEEDFEADRVNMCLDLKRCADNECRGEEVTRLTSVPEIGLQRAIQDAVVKNDVAALTKLFNRKLWVDFYSKDGKSALLKGAEAAQNDAMKFLIEKGANVNLQDANGNSALHLLAASLNEGKAPALDTLVAAKANLEVKNQMGETALITAAKINNLSGVKLLVGAGADKEATDAQGENALFSFARKGDVKAVFELVALGVNPTAKNNSGIAAIDVRDEAGMTLALAAAQKGDLASLKTLIAMGADKNATNALGENALVPFVKKGDFKAALEVIAMGVNPMMKTVEGVVAIDVRDASGDTLVLKAAKAKDAVSVMKLIALGADKNALDKNNENALFSFVRNGNIPAVLALADAGVDTQVKNSTGVRALDIRGDGGDTIMLFAAKYVDMATALKLVKAGANINATDDKGETVVYEAIRKKSLEDLHAIIALGVELETENNAGQTPKKFARKSGFRAGKKLIKQAIRTRAKEARAKRKAAKV